jgi:hypothetical protein
MRGRVSNSLVPDLTLEEHRSYKNQHRKNGKERITCSQIFDVSKQGKGASAFAENENWKIENRQSTVNSSQPTADSNAAHRSSEFPFSIF